MCTVCLVYFNKRTDSIVVLIHQGVAPHFLQFVKPSCFRKHDVNDYVYVIKQNPLTTLTAFVVIRALIAFPFCHVFYGIGNGPNLWLVCGFADDEIIGNSFVNLAQVQRYKVLTLFFLYRPYNGFKDF